jgi:hypothetical protein
MISRNHQFEENSSIHSVTSVTMLATITAMPVRR